MHLGGLLLDIPPGPYRAGYAKARVEARQLLDGSWRIYYHDRVIAQHPATELREPLKTLRRTKKNAKASVPYHWVYQASAPLHPP